MAEERRTALDGLRGVAALSVLAFHCGLKLGAAQAHYAWPMAHGWLAVDLFFVLSGFVVAEAYGARLQAGMTAARFAAVRFRRLYPTYALGVAVGLACALAAWSCGRLEIPLASAALLTALAALLLPTASGALAAFPLNGPAWSLLVEALTNAAYALGVRKRGAKSLAVLLVVLGAGLVLAGLFGPAPNAGSRSDQLWVGLLRGAYSFSAGLLLQQLHRRGALQRLAGAPTAVLLVAVLGVLALPAGPLDKAWETAFILAGSPLLVAFSLGSRPGPRLGRLCGLIGAISYPLYALHAPLLDLAMRLTPGWSIERTVGVALAAGVALVAAAVVAWWEAAGVRLGWARARRGAESVAPA